MRIEFFYKSFFKVTMYSASFSFFVSVATTAEAVLIIGGAIYTNDDVFGNNLYEIGEETFT